MGGAGQYAASAWPRAPTAAHVPATSSAPATASCASRLVPRSNTTAAVWFTAAASSPTTARYAQSSPCRVRLVAIAPVTATPTHRVAACTGGGLGVEGGGVERMQSQNARKHCNDVTTYQRCQGRRSGSNQLGGAGMCRCREGQRCGWAHLLGRLHVLGWRAGGHADRCRVAQVARTNTQEHEPAARRWQPGSRQRRQARRAPRLPVALRTRRALPAALQCQRCRRPRLPPRT